MEAITNPFLHAMERCQDTQPPPRDAPRAQEMPHVNHPSPSHCARGAHLTPAGGTDGLSSILQVFGQVYRSLHHCLDEVHRVEEGREGLRNGNTCRTGWEQTLSPQRASVTCGGCKQLLLQRLGLTLLTNDTWEPGDCCRSYSQTTTVLHAGTYNEVS